MLTTLLTVLLLGSLTGVLVYRLYSIFSQRREILQQVDRIKKMAEQLGWRFVRKSSEYPSRLMPVNVGHPSFQTIHVGTHELSPNVIMSVGQMMNRGKGQTIGSAGLLLRLQLSKSLTGWFRVSPFANGVTLNTDRQLESNQVNHELEILSDPPIVATTIFAPDVMSWYMDLAARPIIYVEQANCFLLYQPDNVETKDISTALTTSQMLGSFLENSGALEKKVEPLFSKIQE